MLDRVQQRRRCLDSDERTRDDKNQFVRVTPCRPLLIVSRMLSLSVRRMLASESRLAAAPCRA